MTMTISKLVQGLEPSPTLAVDQAARRLRAAGVPVLGLAAGQPDFPTPEPICEAAIAAIRRGAGHYTTVAGTVELRQAIADKLARDQALRYPVEQIVVSNGAKHSIYNALLVTVDPGDGVLIPVPYWVSYPAMVRLAGGTPQWVSGERERGFKLTAEQLEAAITPATRVLILNSPSNPTGAVYERGELEQLAEVVARHRLLVITDEIYEKIVFDATEHLSLATVAPELADSIIVVNGVSKAFAMTGWRIGYAAATAPIAAAMGTLQGQQTGNACAVSQAAAAAALRLPEAVIEPMLRAYTARRTAIVSGLERVPGISVTPPAGSFYAYARVEELMAASRCASSSELAQRLLDEQRVAAVPGSAFGTEGYVRFSFAAAQAVIEEAIERLRAFAGAADAAGGGGGPATGAPPQVDG